jgi:hypothetical protein
MLLTALIQYVSVLMHLCIKSNPMELSINENNRLCDIQYAFSKHFPFLKIEFFVFEGGKEKVFSRKHMVTDTTKRLGEITPVLRSGKISIHGHQKVRTLEHHFSEFFGVDIQVFRKSGNEWLQTIVTDDWSLSEQNLMGEEWISPEVDGFMEATDQLDEQL